MCVCVRARFRGFVARVRRRVYAARTSNVHASGVAGFWHVALQCALRLVAAFVCCEWKQNKKITPTMENDGSVREGPLSTVSLEAAQ